MLLQFNKKVFGDTGLGLRAQDTWMGVEEEVNQAKVVA